MPLRLAASPAPVNVGGWAQPRPTPSPLPSRLSDLRVLALNDSFQSEWAGLAAAHGFALLQAAEPAALEPRRGTVTVVSAAGDEGLLEGTLRQMPRGVPMVAAGGAAAGPPL